jgi:hypothetical protein
MWAPRFLIQKQQLSELRLLVSLVKVEHHFTTDWIYRNFVIDPPLDGFGPPALPPMRNSYTLERMSQYNTHSGIRTAQNKSARVPQLPEMPPEKTQHLSLIPVQASPKPGTSPGEHEHDHHVLPAHIPTCLMSFGSAMSHIQPSRAAPILQSWPFARCGSHTGKGKGRGSFDRWISKINHIRKLC